MTTKKKVSLQYGNRKALLAAAASVLLSLSMVSVKGQAPPPSDLADTTSGISNVTDNKEIPMWSTGNEVNVDLTNLSQSAARLDIYEINGQIIFDEKIATGGVYKKQINTSGAAYVIVKITYTNGSLARKLLISNN